MIRRHVGEEFWLITQNDHAIVSGELAEQFGANGYHAPDARTIQATALHDCGWPLHDENPTLNPRGLPLDVFETPRQIGVTVWNASSQRAAEADPYAGLLVSLHSLWISVMAISNSLATDKFDMRDPTIRFEMNKFQQDQIELQEKLRTSLGMRTDEPRKYGLAEQSGDPREQQLIFDFRLLQAMDKLSLAICCTKPPADTIEPLLTEPTGKNRPINVRRISEVELAVRPWPFRSDAILIRVPFRRVRGEPFEDEQTFRAAYSTAPVESFESRLSGG